jgi:molybdenum cofactor biosynthesis enzyme MoaA
MINAVINNSKSNSLRIEYMLGNTCNYKCSYCFPGSNEGTVGWPDVELVKKNLGHLLKHYINNGRNIFEFFLIGGEPTIWKDLPELTKFLKDNFNVAITISTNATPSVKWWNRNAEYYDSIDISVHHEAADVDHIIEVADAIYEKNVHTVANVLMDPTNFDYCKTIVERLKSSRHSWPIIAKSVHYNGITRYTTDQKKYFEKTLKRFPNLIWYIRTNKNPVGNKKVWVIDEQDKKQKVNDSWFSLNKMNYFRGWECSLGIEYVKIHQDGRVSGNCEQKLWGQDFYYNLYDEKFENKFEPKLIPTICEKSICACKGEIVLNKRKV